MGQRRSFGIIAHCIAAEVVCRTFWKNDRTTAGPPAWRSGSSAPLGAFVENGPNEVEAGSGGEERGDSRRIVGRRNLDKIDADDLEPLCDLAENVLAFVVAEAAVTDRGRSRCDRRIEAVDRTGNGHDQSRRLQ